MYTPVSLDNINKKKNILRLLRVFIYKLGGIFEILIVLVFWVLIFSRFSSPLGFDPEDIFTYILIGSLISSATHHLLHRIVIHDISHDNFILLMKYPATYIKKILITGFGRNIFPFIFSVGINISLLYFFLDNFIVNKDPLYLSVIIIIIILAFFTELLILYFFHLFAFWSVESSDSFKFILRLKKIFAGNYFPLSIVSSLFVNISLVLPFSYSFYVPTELYLKKIDISLGFRGIGIQIIWILILYVTIKFAWTRRINKNRIETEEIKLENNQS